MLVQRAKEVNEPTPSSAVSPDQSMAPRDYGREEDKHPAVFWDFFLAVGGGPRAWGGVGDERKGLGGVGGGEKGRRGLGGGGGVLTSCHRSGRASHV